MPPIPQGLLDTDEAYIAHLIEVVSEDPGLHQLLPYFIQFIAEKVGALPAQPCPCLGHRARARGLVDAVVRGVAGPCCGQARLFCRPRSFSV